MGNYVISHLRELESEAIFVIREIAAQFENPVLLFSGGKDSILLTHLAKKAFYPAKIPFPLIFKGSSLRIRWAPPLNLMPEDFTE